MGADCSNASLTFGGEIPTAEDLIAICDLLAETAAGVDWNEPIQDSPVWATHIVTAASSGSAVTIVENDRISGNFPDLENALTALKMPFRRADDGHYAYTPENAVFDGVTKYEAIGTIDSGPAIPAQFVRNMLQKGDIAGLLARASGLTMQIPPIRLGPGVDSKPSALRALFA
jgi:hypothetical protein